jgi:hypothetical protein
VWDQFALNYLNNPVIRLFFTNYERPTPQLPVSVFDESMVGQYLADSLAYPFPST